MYDDRYDAGKKLVDLLKNYKEKDIRVIAIPNGGVPVAAEIVEELGGKMTLLVVRKLQIPYNPEAGFGAVTMDGMVIFNDKLLNYLHLTRFQIEQIIVKTKADIYDRIKYYGIDYTDFRKKVKDKIVVMVDDGLASGYTMLAGVKSVINYNPSEVVIAVPTAPKSSVELLSDYAKVICPNIRDVSYFAVADAYKHWRDLNNDEVLKIIKKLRAENFYF
ncbi:MAG: phosphoribosyltransferase [Candidatus Helarchaeota archaeon]